MKPVIYKYGEFDHKYEEFMFDELLLVLSKVHVSYLLLGNYTFGGLRSNAVLITSKEIRLFIFKDYFSEITPSKKVVWKPSCLLSPSRSQGDSQKPSFPPSA